jgi:hypothetical protein
MHRTVKSFIASSNRQQRINQETFAKTFREMSESSSEEIAGVRARTEIFLEDLWAQIHGTCRAFMFASTLRPHAGLGIGQTHAHVFPRHQDYPDSQGSHAASEHRQQSLRNPYTFHNPTYYSGTDRTF